MYRKYEPNIMIHSFHLVLGVDLINLWGMHGGNPSLVLC